MLFAPFPAARAAGFSPERAPNLPFNDLVALSAHGNERDLALAELFDEFHIVLRRLGKAFEGAAPRDIAVPPLDLLKDGLASVEQLSQKMTS